MPFILGYSVKSVESPWSRSCLKEVDGTALWVHFGPQQEDDASYWELCRTILVRGCVDVTGQEPHVTWEKFSNYPIDHYESHLIPRNAHHAQIINVINFISLKKNINYCNYLLGMLHFPPSFYKLSVDDCNCKLRVMINTIFTA